MTAIVIVVAGCRRPVCGDLTYDEDMGRCVCGPGTIENPGDDGPICITPDGGEPDAGVPIDAQSPPDAPRCAPGTDDCDANAAGCETDVTTSSAHCGACGNACASSEICEESECRALPIQRWERVVDLPDGSRLLDVATDPAGNVYVSGFSSGFGIASFVVPPGGFIAKHTSEGAVVWATGVGAGVYPRSLVVDSEGNLHAAGSAPADDGPGSRPWASSFDASGTQRWRNQTFPDRSLDSSEGPTYSANSLVVFGSYIAVVSTLEEHDAPGSHRLFVDLLSPMNGAILGGREIFSTAFSAWPNPQLAAGSNRLFLVGTFAGALSAGDRTIRSTGTDVFATALSTSALLLQWLVGFGSAGPDRADSVAVDGARNLVIAGAVAGTMTFGSTSVTAMGTDALLAVLDDTGAPMRATSFGGAGADRFTSVSIDASGSIIVGGTSDADVSVASRTLTALGGADVLMAAFDSTLGIEWAARFGGAGEDAAVTSATASGDPIVAATFSGAAWFGGDDLEPAGNLDGVVALYRSR
ncbi:hypothetical protein DB32_006240 [Sandaracinus amylolyticus]|uniref:Uncharacterized protein n=1 Tax=Sandaracinus amylolyticus TaxID=927083 RepID=A0A0F6YL36_9BACT|nr:hypothetical protein DB32_006240 [Sandaracinus amylolyticus]